MSENGSVGFKTYDHASRAWPTIKMGNLHTTVQNGIYRHHKGTSIVIMIKIVRAKTR